MRILLARDKQYGMKVLIAGAGIGGITAALCCLHFGHEVTVLEQATELGEVGAGIQLPPNAMKVFEALGIDTLLTENAFQPEALEARMGISGRSIFTIPLAVQSLQRWRAPYLHIHRADYIEALRQALHKSAPQALKLGTRVKHFTHQNEQVKVTLEDGRQISGDVMIGADGIKSTIRKQMLGPDKVDFTGNLAWRAVVPMSALGPDAPSPTACVWMGGGRHAVTYRLRRGDLVNFVGVVERTDWTHESWTEIGTQEEALQDFDGWHNTITTLIKAVKPGTLYRWALFDRAPFLKWCEGNVTLLGDAAHPMLPFLAQGAAMAVEDSWVLARELAQKGRPIEASLLKYQATRQARTARVQAASRANMKTFHQRTKTGQIKTYGPMWLASKLAPSIVHKRMDWLYGFDVTKD